MTTERDRHDFEKVRSHFAGKARGYEDIGRTGMMSTP